MNKVCVCGQLYTVSATEGLDVLDELRSYAESHDALKGGTGKVDDVLAFIDWYRARLASEDRTSDE